MFVDFLIALAIVIVVSAVVGAVLSVFFGYITYFDPVGDIKKTITWIRKRSWE